MKRTKHLASFMPSALTEHVEQLKEVFQELGHLPNSPRWPV